MAPAYGGYPVVNSTVIPIAQTPIAAPMMVMPAYGPSCVRVPVYTNSTNPATGMVASQGHPPMVSRPKPLTQEVNSYSLQIVLISKFYSPF